MHPASALERQPTSPPPRKKNKLGKLCIACDQKQVSLQAAFTCEQCFHGGVKGFYAAYGDKQMTHVFLLHVGFDEYDACVFACGF